MSTPEPKAFTTDSFQNFLTSVGVGTGNASSGGHYGFNPVSRQRQQMEWAYRGSWVAGRAIDAIADDMTREGVTVKSTDAPDKIAELEQEITRMQIWKKLNLALKWSRLYGGAVAYMMIDGQKPETPLRIETISKGQFKGLMAIDRWALNPSLDLLVSELGVNFGKPEFYDTTPDTSGMPRMRIHYTRVIRLEGIELPYWQAMTENLWGQSVLERLWDRLLAFDSTTQGIAQMVYKAHLRTYKIKGLRSIIAMGGTAMAGLSAQINMIRTMQSNEGLTLMDADDEFEAHAYAFSGLDKVLEKFEDQVCGAVEIPKSRFFGQSSAGLNASGDNEMRVYHDSVKQDQVNEIGPGMDIVYRLAYQSTFGKPVPKGFALEFNDLWQMSEEQNASIVTAVTNAVLAASDGQVVSRSVAMKELKALGQKTGVFTNISDEDITEAENDPAPTPEALGLVPPPAPTGPGGKPGKPGDKPAPPQQPFGNTHDDAESFDPNEPRDQTGKWTKSGGGSASKVDEKKVQQGAKQAAKLKVSTMFADNIQAAYNKDYTPITPKQLRDLNWPERQELTQLLWNRMAQHNAASFAERDAKKAAVKFEAEPNPENKAALDTAKAQAKELGEKFLFPSTETHHMEPFEHFMVHMSQAYDELRADMARLSVKPRITLKPGDHGYKDAKARLEDLMKAKNKDGSKASELMIEALPAPPPTLSDENMNAVAKYAADSSNINLALRNLGGGSIGGLPPEMAKQASLLDKMILESQGVDVPLDLVRGIPPHLLEGLKVGDTYVDHAYASTSFSKAVSADFSEGGTLNITIPKGFKFLSVPSISDVARHADNAGWSEIGSNGIAEAEALLPRGTGMRVKKLIMKRGKVVGAHLEAIYSSIQPAT